MDSHIYLQEDLDNLYKQCCINRTLPNINKYKHMVFCRVNALKTSFKRNNVQIQLSHSITDLGVLFDRKLSFSAHITIAFNKTTSTLGFFKRWAKKFRGSYTMAVHIARETYSGILFDYLESRVRSLA